MEILELENTISEINNETDGLNRKIKTMEKRIRKLEDITIESTQYEQKRRNRLKKINSGTCGTTANIYSIHIIRDPKEKKLECGSEKPFREIIAKNFFTNMTKI